MKITYCSQKVAEELIPNSSMAIISIAGMFVKRNLKPGWGARIDMTFDDINAIPEDVASYDVVLFDEIIADTIAKFVFTLPPQINHIVVHCRQGLGRSATIAKVLCEEKYNQPFPKDWPFINARVYTLFKKAIQKRI